MPLTDEILGADFCEHNVRHEGYDFDEMVKGLEEMGYRVHHPWCHEIHPNLLVSKKKPPNQSKNK